MAIIPQLAIVDALSLTDYIPFWSQANGDTRRISVQNLVNLISTAAGITSPTVYRVSPSGEGVTIASPVGRNVWVLSKPSADYAATSFQFPLQTLCQQGDKILFTTNHAITTLTSLGNGSTIIGQPTAMSANGSFTMMYDAVNIGWFRVA